MGDALTHQRIELGCGASGTTGWGLIALHVALGLERQGCIVHLPAESDLTAVSPPLVPTLRAMMTAVPSGEHAVRIDAYGNHHPSFQFIPNRTRVLFCVFEDTAIPGSAIDELRKYDLVLTPSTWAHDILAAKGLETTVWHQGYDESVFYPAPRRRPDGPFYIFSGGKLEFRKGQDIVVEAFRRFRETPEGKDAILVTAWQNRWPQTMEGIWASGYVKGIPVQRGSSLDVVSWLEANGLPRESVIDLGFLSQPAMADAIRECDVALFPNRCEGATNMQLPEVLGCGVPAIVSWCCGHVGYGPVYATGTKPVTLPCALYKGFDGWGEADPSSCAQLLQYALGLFAKAPAVRDPSGAEYAREHFGWRNQTNHLYDLIAEIPRA